MHKDILSKTLVLLCISCMTGITGSAQLTRYIVELTDKQYNPFSILKPWEFLTQSAIERRSKYQIAYDSTDLPVTPRYLDSIRMAGSVTILNTSKWLNQVAIRTTDPTAISKINSFSFVKKTTAIANIIGATHPGEDKFAQPQNLTSEASFAPPPAPQNAVGYYDYGRSNGQVKIHQGDFLHNHGFRGRGMEMAVIDAGFLNYLTLPTFDSIRLNNQVLGTWDFVNNEASVNEDHSHGSLVLAMIAANNPGSLVGTAPETSYYLYRTEDVANEYPIEEQNFAAAVERADSLGVGISSISLGYNTFDDASLNYTYADMDGNTTISARAADFAAHKGMLLLIAVGNSGTDSWKFLITPADADSVLAVGAVDTLGTVADFSSYGPSSDGQVKPGVASVGWRAATVDPSTGAPANYDGTSLACPNMAGLATCLWQAFPEANNMGIISALQESANRFANPDDRSGYGIPDMKKAFVILQKRLYTQAIRQAGCDAFIDFTLKRMDGMNVEIQRKLPSDPDFVSIQLYNGIGPFTKNSFHYADDLSGYTNPISISYRVKMDIPGDTSFYFDPVVINHLNSCNTYTFNGNGSWTNPSNWIGGLIPPTSLPAGSTIVIDPGVNGECILNITQEVQAGAYFNVRSNKKLIITGNLNNAL